MTRQEAIETIKIAISQVEWEYPMDYAVAFDMAVEALSQPEIIRCQDCRFKGETDSPFWDYWCDRQERNVDREWFCADGKLKEGVHE